MRPRGRAGARQLLGTPAGIVATAGGIGLSPVAPGTVGSLAALLPAWLLVQLPVPAQLAIVAAAFAVGVLACDRIEARIGEHDAAVIVWDEVVGIWLTLLAAPPTVTAFAVAFAWFRCFDIVKPGPVGWVDRRVGGGLGVMLDDLVAAGLAWMATRATLQFGAALA